MSNAHSFRFTITSRQTPIVQLTDEGLYIYFKPGAVSEKTVVRSRWPLVAIDLDKNGDVIGIEAVPPPESFTLRGLIAKAGGKITDKALANAQFKRVIAAHHAVA
jgi:uncharacterized protein YuzE